MRAFIFPGQGSQTVGMGLEEYRDRGRVRDIFDRANGVLGYRLSDVMFEGPVEKLSATEHAQPALFIHSLALYDMLDSPEPAMAAGHSLGEYSALTAAGAIPFDDALHLVDVRGREMARAGDERPGTMGAIVGLDDDMVQEICDGVSDGVQIVVPANYNSDGQVVVSGSVDGVRKALAEAKGAGARMAREINVSGAFHSPLMDPAAKKFAEALAEAPFSDARFPVYMNVVAKPVTDGGEIRELLLKQLTSPVLWSQSVNRMIADGATEFIEVGAGNVLQKLVRRISPDVATRSVATMTDVDQMNGKEN
jgi:[acyl-carrier-protein] S-malonyltransferase